MSIIQTSRIHNVDVGTPPSSLSTEGEWEIIQVRYHGFQDLTTTRNDHVVSPEFTCFGHQWHLKLYPGGTTDSEDGMVSIFLHNLSNKSIKVQYGLHVKNKGFMTGWSGFISKDEGNEFAGNGTGDEDNGVFSGWGRANFHQRTQIIDALVDGTFIMEVRMRNVGETTTSPFIPVNPISKNILSKFMDEESADVVFEVGTQSEIGRNTRKRAKTSTTFYAHRLILQDGATMLGEMCKSGGKSDAISITDVSPEIFRHLLYYVYGGKVSVEELKANAKEIIDAADRYGVVNLKLEAEAYYVKSIAITLENMLDNLLYAASKNCALLQETVLDFVVENSDEVSEKVSVEEEDIPSTVMLDLLAAMSRKIKGGKGGVDSLSTMRVSELRQKLHEKGLDIDGSRKAMIATLKEHQQS